MNASLEQKAVEVISQIQKLAPKATELALQTAQINAISNIFGGLVFLALFIAGCFAVRKIYRIADEDDIGLVVLGVGIGLATAICGFGAVIGLGEVWNWVGLFRPDLFLAHKVI